MRQKMQNPDLSSSSSSDGSDEESEPEDDDDNDPTGTNALILQSRKEAAAKLRAERKEKSKVEKADSLRLASDRRAKGVKLNTSGRISGGGGTSNPSPPIKCYGCGQEGHVRAKCPSVNNQKGRSRSSLT